MNQYMEKVKYMKTEYCSTRNAEEIPKYCNEFLSFCLDDMKVSFGNLDPIEVVYHLCEWLLEKGYTYYERRSITIYKLKVLHNSVEKMQDKVVNENYSDFYLER